jgi:hypothetical protein
MKADMPLAERRRLEREQQAEIRAMLAPRHFAAMEEQMAVDAYWLAYALEAGPVISALLARMGHGPAPVAAPVVIPEPESVALAPVPESLPVRPGAPDVPFDLRQRFGLR